MPLTGLLASLVIISSAVVGFFIGWRYKRQCPDSKGACLFLKYWSIAFLLFGLIHLPAVLAYPPIKLTITLSTLYAYLFFVHTAAVLLFYRGILLLVSKSQSRLYRFFLSIFPIPYLLLFSSLMFYLFSVDVISLYLVSLYFFALLLPLDIFLITVFLKMFLGASPLQKHKGAVLMVVGWLMITVWQFLNWYLAVQFPDIWYLKILDLGPWYLFRAAANIVILFAFISCGRCLIQPQTKRPT